MIQWQAIEPKPDIHVRKAALSKFSQRFPERLDIRLNLADQHFYLGEMQNAWNVLEDAPHEVRNNPDWLAAYGKTARKLGHDEMAEECLSRAWKQGSEKAGLELARLLSADNQVDEAIAVCRALLEQKPANFAAAQLLAKNLIASGQLEALANWASDQLRKGQWNAVLPSAMAYAGKDPFQNGMGDEHVGADPLPVCIDALTGTSPNDSLRDVLLNHKSRSNFPTIYAGKGTGQRIDRVLDLGIPEVTALFDQIKRVIEDYVQNAVLHRTSSAFADSPQKASIESWVNICTGDGYEDWHCHPAGWLSGVYYLDVPDLAGAPDKAGQIEFGPLMLGDHNDLEKWPRRRVTPKIDMLLLFPSYIGHRTYPTGLQEPRISIAFDVVPASDA